MYKEHVIPNENNPDELLKVPVGSGIQATDWAVFVHNRTTTEFKEFSEIQKKRRAKHVYPHRLSRKGYAKLAEEIKGSTNELHGDEELARCQLWKKARLKKDGTTDNENLQIAMQKIDEYICEKEQGALQSEEGSSDLLSLALDKPEHAGRVRGKGAGVKPKIYFHTAKGTRRATVQAPSAEIEKAKKKIEEQANQIQFLDKEVHELKSKMEKFECKMGNNDKESEGIDSCYVMKIATHEKHMESHDTVCIGKSEFLQGKEVKLLEQASKKPVAYGTVFVVGPVLHSSPMPADCFRVSIDEAIDPNARLPFPVSDEMETVQDALGSHVA